MIYTANYHTAVLSVFRYNDSGKLDLVDTITHKAETLGPRPEQVDGPHPHFFDETPAGNLVSCDLGNDTVDFYRLENDQLKHIAQYKCETGFGTRHIVFSKDGNYFYVVGELSSQINVLNLTKTLGTLKILLLIRQFLLILLTITELLLYILVKMANMFTLPTGDIIQLLSSKLTTIIL